MISNPSMHIYFWNDIDEFQTEEANKVLEEFKAELTNSQDIEIDNAEEEIVDSENPFVENRCDFCDKMFIR